MPSAAPYDPPNVSSIARSITSGLRWLYIAVTWGFGDNRTMHRLGLFEELGRNLKTTNGIEN